VSKTYFIRTEERGTLASLEPGLAARVHDPLWLLGRQWQIGELLGDDAGSPVFVDLAAETASLIRFLRPGQTSGVKYDPSELPLEALTADSVRPHKRWTARMRVDVGRAFVRALADGGVGGYGPAYLTAYPIGPASADTIAADPAGAMLLGVAAGRLPDGRALYADLEPVMRGGAALPATPAIPPGDIAAVRRAAEAWLAWCDETIVETGATTWAPDRLAHEFAVATGAGAGATVLDAPDFRGDSLDWHSFDVRPNAQRSGFTPLPAVDALPTGVRFRGMPNARWWELEDASIDFGSVDAGPSDVARLAMLEFGLVYGNDFFAVPLPLPVGSLCRITSLVVGDTFGMRLQIRPAAHGSARQGDNRWSMFTLSERSATSPSTGGVADLFFLPPVAHQLLTGPPVENVLLLRDETANLAWAVEHSYEGEAGGAIERIEEMTRAVPERTVPAADAPLRYRLGTTVPPNWFPLVPVLAGGDVRLQLERMANQPASVLPRGRFLLLRDPPLPDADVPREGTRLLRDYALTRWTNGATLLWARRLRRVGRGEGSSGLRFDLADADADGV
jgi:hypothetical protein